MLWSIEKLKTMDDFKDVPEDTLKIKIKAIETAIRAYTNNNFQERFIRFVASSRQNVLDSCHAFLKVGDTIEITQSLSNNGLYTIENIKNGATYLNQNLNCEKFNLVTLIKYPDDILEGALSMLKWNIENADKIGVASETISRHSVTYFGTDKSNTILGYPAAIMGFLNPYVRAKT